ncbi:dapper homolog 1 [Eublepharis macularius]|uniref:Dapper homolog 1 n=1 Tax=Eublepharis macularius TaxID=481883 RepID=A0AA97IYJ2_EUBMA|nr:dapper homolog 1 [Eublepharis macularius]
MALRWRHCRGQAQVVRTVCGRSASGSACGGLSSLPRCLGPGRGSVASASVAAAGLLSGTARAELPLPPRLLLLCPSSAPSFWGSPSLVQANGKIGAVWWDGATVLSSPPVFCSVDLAGAERALCQRDTLCDDGALPRLEESAVGRQAKELSRPRLGVGNYGSGTLLSSPYRKKGARTLSSSYPETLVGLGSAPGGQSCWKSAEIPALPSPPGGWQPRPIGAPALQPRWRLATAAARSGAPSPGTEAARRAPPSGCLSQGAPEGRSRGGGGEGAGQAGQQKRAAAARRRQRRDGGGAAGAAAPLSGSGSGMKASAEAGQPQPQEGEARCPREGGRSEATEAERLRTRERLEATLAGLAELAFLRRRQELRVRRLLLGVSPAASPPARPGPGEPPPPPGDGAGAGAGAAARSLEEKFLEENILLLRRQLNCLRRRDAGLLNQLQELDKQISDLRLDVEKTAEEHLEMDSRPSSGFYELSDGGASGSLSNSSNSVFSECLSSCPSSACFCSPLDASVSSSDGRPKSTDLIGWMEHNKGSQHEDQSVGIVSHSLSTTHSNSLEVVADVHPKYQCDLVSKNGNDVYRYPSPLHAVAVQSPMFLLPVMSTPLREEEDKGIGNVDDICVGSELDTKTGTSSHLSDSQSASVPAATKKMDGYILSLVQKKIPSVRTNKPRTNLNADPAKGILRHGSICARQASGVTPNNAVPLKNSIQVFPRSAAASTILDNGTVSPSKQHLRELNSERPEAKKIPLSNSLSPNSSHELQSKPSLRTVRPQEAVRCPVVSKGDGPQEGGQTFVTKESPFRHTAPLKENKAIQLPKKILLKSSGVQATHSVSPPRETRPSLDFKSEGSSSQSIEEGLLVNAHYIPAQPQPVRLHKSTRNVRILKSSMVKHRSHLVTVLENSPLAGREKGKPGVKKCRFPNDLDTNKKPKKTASRGKKNSHLQPETNLLSRPPGVLKSTTRPHGHSREPVVAKPKHKRADYRRWKLSAEVSYEEALKRARRNQREGLGVYSQVPHPYVSPYAYVASDSEYSAECESLFHSTVVDTSEDERSNYTTNCFGDSESSLSEVEFVGESTTTSDSDESGGLIWSQFVQTLPLQTVTATAELHENAAKAFVKIKASHNLKKKILRFRSGSLKLMTTV